MHDISNKLDQIHIKDDLFKDVMYFVTGDIQAKVTQLLEKGGALVAKYMQSRVTHLLCGKNFSEDVINENIDLYEIPVVNENWVIQSGLLGRLAAVKPYHPIANKLFGNFIAAIVNVNAKDRKLLYCLITYYGGSVHCNFDKQVNLLICGAPSGAVYAKALQIKTNDLNCVTPDWVITSVKSKAIQPFATYHPRLLITNNSKPQQVNRQMSDNNANNNNNNILKSIIGFEVEGESNSQVTENKVNNPLHPKALPQTLNTASTIPAVVQQPQLQQQPQQQQTNFNKTQSQLQQMQQQHQMHSQQQMQQQQQPQQQQQQFRPQVQFQQLSQQNKAILQQQNIQIQKVDHLQAINPNLIHQNVPAGQPQPQQQQQQQTQRQQSQEIEANANPTGDIAMQQPQPNPTQISIQHLQQQSGGMNQMQQNINPQQQQTQNQSQQQQQQQQSMNQINNSAPPPQQQQMITQKFIVSTSGPPGASGQQQQIIQNHMLSQQKQQIIQNLMLSQQNQQMNKQVSGGGGGVGQPTQIQIIQTSKGQTIGQHITHQPLKSNTMIIQNQQINVSQGNMSVQSSGGNMIQVQQQQINKQQQQQMINQTTQQPQQQHQQPNQQQQPQQPQQSTQQIHTINKQIILNSHSLNQMQQQQQGQNANQQQIVVVNSSMTNQQSIQHQLQQQQQQQTQLMPQSQISQGVPQQILQHQGGQIISQGGGNQQIQQIQGNQKIILQQHPNQQLIQQNQQVLQQQQQQQQNQQQRQYQYIHNIQQQQPQQMNQLHLVQQQIQQQQQQQQPNQIPQQMLQQTNQQQIISQQVIQQQQQQQSQSQAQQQLSQITQQMQGGQQQQVMQQIQNNPQVIQQMQQNSQQGGIPQQQIVQAQQQVGQGQQQQGVQQQQQLIHQQQQMQQQMNYQLIQQQKLMNQQQQQHNLQQQHNSNVVQQIPQQQGQQQQQSQPPQQQVDGQVMGQQQQQGPNQQIIQAIQNQQQNLPQQQSQQNHQIPSQMSQQGAQSVPQQSQVPQGVQQNQIVIQSNQIPVQVGQQPQQQQQQPQPVGQPQWTPQSPVQQQVVQQQVVQQQVVQQGGLQPGQQFVRATRPGWTPVNSPGPQRQLVHLDAQTHNHLQTLDPVRRAEYILKIQKEQRNLMLRQQVAFQGRPGVPRQNLVGAPRPGTQHIVIRSQPQQVQWIPQQGSRPPILVRPGGGGGAPGLSPISQQVVTPTGTPGPPQFPTDPNSPQQQAILLQRQYQRMQQIQHQREQASKAVANQQQPTNQALSPRGFGNGENVISDVITSPVGATPPQMQPPTTPTPSGGVVIQQSQVILPDGQNPNQNQMNSKTKTALANMLSNRLNNNGTVPPSEGTNVPPTEPSAAGTLRLMTQQHNAALNPVVRTPHEIAALQQQQQQQQNQRRTLGNITNNATIVPQVVSQMPPGAAVITVPPPAVGIKGPPGPYSPGRAPIPRSQFYGHNPNLKLPADLFLLGCTFYIVEYDESHGKELNEWKELIRKHGGEIEGTYCAKVTHVLCRTQRHGVVMQAIRDSKRCVTAYWLSDSILKKQVAPPSQALHLPSPSTFGTQKPAIRHIISISGFEGEERVRIKNMVEESGAKLTEYFSKHNTVLICKKPEGPKYKYAKECNIPIVNTIWLSDILLGNLSAMSQFETTKYQQFNVTGPFRIDYALVAHLMNAWKSPINLTPESHERVKRSLQESSPTPKPKRMRTLPPLEDIPDEIICNTTPEPENVPKILFSQVDNVEGLKRAVTTLGGIVVTEPGEASHLVMTKLRRTIKLLYGLCSSNYIVSSKWIVESAKAGKFLSPDDYKLDDTQFNTNFNCDIYATLQQPNRNKLFEGKIFYMTPSVYPSTQILHQIIELCGGTVEKQRRSANRIQETIKQSLENYIILSCIKDFHLIVDLAKLSNTNRIVCTTEYIMTSILTQKIDLEQHIINNF